MEAAEGLDLTFKQAMELAVNIETTEKCAPGMDASMKTSGQMQSVSVKKKHFRKPQQYHEYRPEYRNRGPTPNRDRQPVSSASCGRLCYRCNSPRHIKNTKQCKYKEAECTKCRKKGHIAPACRGKPPFYQHAVGIDSSTNAPRDESVQHVDEFDGAYGMYHVNEELHELSNLDSDLCMTANDQNIIFPVSVNGAEIDFELDTGAVVSCVSVDTYAKIRSPGEELMQINMKLRDYNKKPLDIAGVALVTVSYNTQCRGGGGVSGLGKWKLGGKIMWKVEIRG